MSLGGDRRRRILSGNFVRTSWRSSTFPETNDWPRPTRKDELFHNLKVRLILYIRCVFFANLITLFKSNRESFKNCFRLPDSNSLCLRWKQKWFFNPMKKLDPCCSCLCCLILTIAFFSLDGTTVISQLSPKSRTGIKLETCELLFRPRNKCFEMQSLVQFHYERIK